jgi:hypothetical protein
MLTVGKGILILRVFAFKAAEISIPAEKLLIFT